MFDPHGWSEDSYYEALGIHLSVVVLVDLFFGVFVHAVLNWSLYLVVWTAKAQKIEMDKLEKAKKERTKVSSLTRF